jgi:hypothetical protein
MTRDPPYHGYDRWVTVWQEDEPEPERIYHPPENEALILALAQGAVSAKSLTAERQPRKPRHDRVIAQAKKGGASSVTTVDGVTYRFGNTDTDDVSRELAAFEARHAKA